MIEKSLQEVGAARSIVIDEDNNILAGNGMVEAAGNAGIEKLRIVETDGNEIVAVCRRGLTADQKKKLALYDNRTAELADWDVDVLKDFSLDTDLSGLFTKKELIEIGFDEKEIVEDEIPEVPKVAKTVKGDLYELGRHRLLCGDSTNSDDVARLMDRKKAVLFATDPPYGIDYSNSGTNSSSLKGIWDDIKFDDLRDLKLQEFLHACFISWLPFLEENAAWYLWHAHLTQGFFAAAAAAADVILHRQIIWVKPQLIMGMGMFHWKHEPCFMGWRKGPKPPWYGDRKQTTVWEIGYEGNRNKGSGKEHPTQKPVEIFARPINYHTKENEIVADPFLGSGTQLIAAEQTNRICYGMEISEVYNDVIVKRYAKFMESQGKDYSIRLNGKDVTDFWRKQINATS